MGTNLGWDVKIVNTMVVGLIEMMTCMSPFSNPFGF